MALFVSRLPSCQGRIESCCEIMGHEELVPIFDARCEIMSSVAFTALFARDECVGRARRSFFPLLIGFGFGGTKLLEPAVFLSGTANKSTLT